MSGLNGLIVLNKQPGQNSARAVDAVKWLLSYRTKVGHAGTLDRFASGVLILLLGKSTRLCEQIMSWPKTYVATIKLGVTTPTNDPESTELPGNALPVSLSSVENALSAFVGDITQRPPAYSAVKINGRRASDRARAGTPTELRPRQVRIHEITVNSYIWPQLQLRIRCGRGTYIRSLAHDLGETLGVGGYVLELQRSQIGAYGLEHAVRLDQLTKENIRQFIVS